MSRAFVPSTFHVEQSRSLTVSRKRLYGVRLRGSSFILNGAAFSKVGFEHEIIEGIKDVIRIFIDRSS